MLKEKELAVFNYIKSRISEGIWAPRMPKLMRLITGKGTPVLRPM